jgi:hypothetical protein
MRRLFWSGTAVVVLALALGLGGWVGWRLYAEAERKGCVQLPSDVVSLDLRPTAPDRVRFAAIGDAGTGNAVAHQVAEVLRGVCAREGCDFVTMLGDSYYPVGVSGPEDPQFQSSFESVFAGLKGPPFADAGGRSVGGAGGVAVPAALRPAFADRTGIPMLPVLGNHDVKMPGSARYMVFHSRESDLWRMPNYEYAYRVGPARFFAINTNCPPLTWWRLKDRLEEPFAGWTFVMGHHALYSEGPHGDENWATHWFWDDLQPKVQFYLAGHNHLLEHLQREGQGTDYVVSGSAGGDKVGPPDSDDPSAATLRFQNPQPGFAWFDVQAERVTWRFYGTDGQVLYEHTRTR